MTLLMIQFSSYSVIAVSLPVFKSKFSSSLRVGLQLYLITPIYRFRHCSVLRDPFFGSWVYYHHVCSSDWEDESICVCGDMMQSRRWRSLLKAMPPGNCRVSKIVSGGFGSVAPLGLASLGSAFPRSHLFYELSRAEPLHLQAIPSRAAAWA